jgi:hypothetical protein
MVKAIKFSKWYWWIPGVSLFYIEEQSEWATNGCDDKEVYMRTMLISFLLAYQAIFAILLALYFN